MAANKKIKRIFQSPKSLAKIKFISAEVIFNSYRMACEIHSFLFSK